MERQRSVKFIAECHADTALVRFLLPSEIENIIHEAGINNVSKNFETVRDGSAILVGIIDDDKRKPTYLVDFEDLEVTEWVHLKKKPGAEHYIILICPALEKFLLNDCHHAGKALSDFGFSDEFKAFRKQTKTPSIEKNEDFSKILSFLITENAPGISTLSRFLERF